MKLPAWLVKIISFDFSFKKASQKSSDQSTDKSSGQSSGQQSTQTSNKLTKQPAKLSLEQLTKFSFELPFFNNIRFIDKLLFTKHLSMMTKTDTTILEALDILGA